MKKIYSLFLVVALAILSYLFLDKDIALFFNHIDKSVKDIFKFITRFGRSEFYLIPALLLYIYFKNSNHLYALRAKYILFSVALSGIVINIIKVIVARYRPVKLFEDGEYGFSFFGIGHDINSFPSGHSATSLGVAFALSYLYPKYRYIFISFGVLVAFSRVVLTQHYLSDVLVGGYIGFITSLLLYKRYFGDKFGV